MPKRSRRRNLQAGSAPQRTECDRVVTASVVAVDIEDFHRVEEFSVVPRRVMPILNLLEPKRVSLLCFCHFWRDRMSDNLLHRSEIAPVGQPWVNHVFFADIFHPYGAIGFPCLDIRSFATNPATHR